MYWDEGNKTPTVVIDADVALQLGQEMLALVYNNSGSTITNGSVVAVNGAQGQRPAVVLADADSEALSAPTLGIATEDIAAGAEGFITTFGFVRGLNTAAFTAGNPIYLSQTAGQFTATRPTAPAHTVALGWVIKVNASSGEVFVNINNGWELDELHNVLISSPISGNTLIYDAVAGVWKNANLTAGTGISVTGGAGSITVANTGVTSVTASTGISVSSSTGGVTITNSAPDQTVALTAGTGISTSGTYPNFTITNTAPSSGGTVTSVSGTGSYGGLTLSGTVTTSGSLTLGGTPTGTWPISVSGSAASATTATTASTANALNSANSYTAVSFISTSDEQLKTNWAGLDLDFVARLSDVKHGTFERINSGVRDAGVSAQSLQKVLPEAVVQGEDGYLAVNYGGAALVAAIELAKVVQELRAEIAMLKAKVGE